MHSAGERELFFPTLIAAVKELWVIVYMLLLSAEDSKCVYQPQ